MASDFAVNAYWGTVTNSNRELVVPVNYNRISLLLSHWGGLQQVTFRPVIASFVPDPALDNQIGLNLVVAGDPILLSFRELGGVVCLAWDVGGFGTDYWYAVETIFTGKCSK